MATMLSVINSVGASYWRAIINVSSVHPRAAVLKAESGVVEIMELT